MKGFYMMDALDSTLSLDDVLIANALCDMQDHFEAKQAKASS